MTWPTNKPASGMVATGRGRGGPSRGARPPFAKGHTLTLTNGARSPRVYEPLAEQLLAGLLDERPDLAAYPEAVAAWATAEAQATLFRRHLAEVGPLDETGEPRKAVLTWARSMDNAAARHRATLGLDPRSEATLARERAEAVTLAADLDGLAQRGRAILSAREAAGIDPPRDLAGEALDKVRAEGEHARREWTEAWAASKRQPDADDTAPPEDVSTTTPVPAVAASSTTSERTTRP